MPKYYEDVEETKTKKKFACEGIRDDLLECLLKTDCVMKEKRTPRDCMSDPSIPDECNKLRVAFLECRRSMLDMRTRFRGRKDY
ncbi:cytochrome c oxidase assembly factor 5 [Aplysia californica]|uniref:Cytochrome c oxidase assembly factor 5 n=1 Tax=Aplysia californica TaxID=6500 RepID=A0ABM0K226_APLCA|nr:cytochrome c oxidase assembly factor 5 [Aplysia californica]